MNRKAIIFSIFFISLTFFKCTDLVEEPKGLLAPESFFKTTADVEAGLFGAYAQYAHIDLYGRQLSLLLMLRSDMAAIGDLGTVADRKQIDDFNMNSENDLSTKVWTTFYKSISAANTTIEAARSVEGDATKKVSLEAEARFIRAFSYFNLVRLFGDVPYLNNPVETTEQLKGVSRTPVTEVYEYILADLEFAKENLSDEYPGGNRNRATTAVASTVLADVYLTLEQFDKAAAEARHVINNADGLYDYQLEANFQDLYNGDLAGSLKEPIFVVDWHNGITNVDWLIPMTRIRGLAGRSLSVAVPTNEVYTSWDSRDYRREVSLEDSVIVDGVKVHITEAERASVKRPHIAKYFRYPGPQPSGNDRFGDTDYYIYRYADVLLMAAEAIAESEGVNPEAIGYIDQIKERARFNGTMTNTFPEDVSSSISTADFIALVREERRIELAFEFKRWFDIKRWQILEESFTGPDALEQRPVDPKRDYLFPIPLEEIQLNGWTQNFGYE